jgi:hypothetical protein
MDAPGAGERAMRFIVCARDREDGAMVLVSAASFPNRREAVEAIIASQGLGALLDSDVFLIDLEAAAPVALVPVTEVGETPASSAAAGIPGVFDEPSAGSDNEPLFEGVGEVLTEGPDEAAEEAAAEAEGVTDHLSRFGPVELDIASWTCEDCIYVMTCDSSGANRPVDCASFQWRA